MERAEFQTQMNASKRALEAEDARLKEEEQRLQRLKDELARYGGPACDLTHPLYLTWCIDK